MFVPSNTFPKCLQYTEKKLLQLKCHSDTGHTNISELVNLVQGMLPHRIKTFPGVFHKAYFFQLLVDTTPSFNYRPTSLIILKINVRMQVTPKKIHHRWRKQIVINTFSSPGRGSRQIIPHLFGIWCFGICQLVLMQLKVVIIF